MHPASWDEYAQSNVRDQKMASFWIRPVIEFLRRRVTDPGSGLRQSILDFGCSYFDLGDKLDADVDGFDPDPLAIEIARSRMRGAARQAILVQCRSEIPCRKYDWIIANSVIQYFQGIADLEIFIDDCVQKWARPGRVKILLSDIIPEEYSPAIDAVENLAVAMKNGFMLPMLRHLYHAAQKPSSLPLRRYSADEISAVAGRHGMTTTRLADNLTPSRRRFTLLLEKNQP